MNVSHRPILILLLLVALLGQVAQVSASEDGNPKPSTLEDGTLVLNRPETNQFPIIQARFDVYDSAGQYVSDLGVNDIQVIEDGKALRPDAVMTEQNGLQVILVLNTGPAMGQAANGVSEYQRVQTALLNWAQEQAAATEGPATGAGQASIDDFSLVTPTGMFLIRSQEPVQLVKALTDYQPDLPQTQPNLNSLAEALDLATDPLATPFMKRSILYITPPIEGASAAPLSDLAARAREIGVRVNVWVMAPNATTPVESTPPAEGEEAPATLQTIAQVTGGQYTQITPADALPEVEQAFAHLRQSYQIQYTSAIQTSGSHNLSLQISQGALKLTSARQSFNLDVLPPNPIFLSPPTAIERSWTVAEKNSAPVLTPNEVALEILVEFPDQHPRELSATRLYLDGKLIYVNNNPPFERFSWPLDELEVTGTHQLRVEAEDILGLSGSSIEIPIDVVVKQPAKTGLFENFSERGMIAVGAMAASGAVLALVLILTSSQRWVRRRNQSMDKKRLKDPVTQPVQIRQEQARKPKDTRPRKGQAASQQPTWPPPVWQSSAWPRAHVQNAPARLINLDENEQPITGGVLPLTRLEVTFGSDPRRATQVLESPTVDSLHARLYRSEDGKFFLADQNSIAGTWVNYAPVTAAGAALEHGDLIHIGKVIFRFELTDPSKAPQAEIKVVSLEKRL